MRYMLCPMGVMLLTLVLAAPRASAVAGANGGRQLLSSGANIEAAMSFAPGFGAHLHRLGTRAQHSLDRVGDFLSHIVVVWLWMALSVSVFLMVSALSCAADVRMLYVRRRQPLELIQDFVHGGHTFFRILLDRQAPYLARMVLAIALVYWLVPFDLIPDHSLFPGFVDDVLVVIVAAKLFLYLCPESLVARHATAVEAQTHP